MRTRRCPVCGALLRWGPQGWEDAGDDRLNRHFCPDAAIRAFIGSVVECPRCHQPVIKRRSPNGSTNPTYFELGGRQVHSCQAKPPPPPEPLPRKFEAPSVVPKPIKTNRGPVLGRDPSGSRGTSVRSQGPLSGPGGTSVGSQGGEP
jgi:hypothetical protein